MSTPKVKKVRVALKLHQKTDLQLIDFCNHILQTMTGNINFPSPQPTLAAMTTATNALDAAVKIPKPHTPTQTADIQVKRKLLRDLMTSTGAYVEGVANLDPVNALTILKSSGMTPHADPKPKLNGFRFLPNAIPGQVKLATDRTNGAMYKWQYTLTPADETSWKTQESNVTKTVIPLLISGARYSFRVAVVLKVAGPWSNVISIIVM
jgi:hypothetical protein